MRPGSSEAGETVHFVFQMGKEWSLKEWENLAHSKEVLVGVVCINILACKSFEAGCLHSHVNRCCPKHFWHYTEQIMYGLDMNVYCSAHSLSACTWYCSNGSNNPVEFSFDFSESRNQFLRCFLDYTSSFSKMVEAVSSWIGPAILH